ncbi:MAG: fibronectin type III domain-containing protein [Coriobacteriales bacterium]|nr:fibronectin type III domain-containing protein [Coriobacteriales bacterium]
MKGRSKKVGGLKAGGLYQVRVRAVAGKARGAWSNVCGRYLAKVSGVKASVKKSGSVTATWEADANANAGYVVVVRYKKGGKVVAKVAVAKGKTKATVKGLKKAKKYWVEVRPVRTSGGKTYAGVPRGTWTK